MSRDSLIPNLVYISDDDTVVGFRLAVSENKLLLHAGFQTIEVNSFEHFKVIESELLFEKLILLHNDILYKAITKAAVPDSYKEQMLDAMVYPRISLDGENIDSLPISLDELLG